MARRLAYTVHLGDGVSFLKGAEESDEMSAAFDAAGVEPGDHIWEDYQAPDDGGVNPAATPVEPVEATGAAAGPVHTPEEVFTPDIAAARPGDLQTDEQVEEPPRAGAGSGRDRWAAYAESLGQTVPEDAGRDDIIEQLERVGLV